MFRKIHSNRDPGATVLSELRNEFKNYFEQASVVITQKMQKRPKLMLIAMTCCILLSAGLSFTLCRNPAPAETGKSAKHVNVVSDGFSQITTTANAIQQTIRLKRQIDSLCSKKTLSKQDSATLENDLDQLKP